MNASVPTEITHQVSSACSVIGRHLASSLQAIHLFGSAVDGGLKPHSDIDLLVTVSAPLTEAVRHALVKELLSVSAWPMTRESLRPLEVTVVVRDAVVPWRYPPSRELQFGEWLRGEMEAGHVQPAIVDPDLTILLAKARRHSICLLGAPATDLFDPVPRTDLARAFYDTVLQWNEPADWRGDERTVVLALARIWFSLSTGESPPRTLRPSGSLNACRMNIKVSCAVRGRLTLERRRTTWQGEARKSPRSCTVPGRPSNECIWNGSPAIRQLAEPVPT